MSGRAPKPTCSKCCAPKASSRAMLGDGYHDVPPGKIAAVVTHLEMRAPVTPRPGPAPEGAELRRIAAPDTEWYRDLFARVGGHDWLWFSRLRMCDADLAAILRDRDVEVHGLFFCDRAEGFLELDFRQSGDCELAFFGVTPALIGTGAGRFLMTRAIARAFARPIARLHVHTCTLDHPGALSFYRRCGFVPVRQQIEIADDPRLTGDAAPDAGPHVPVFRA